MALNSGTNLFQLQNASKQYGPKILFENVSVAVNEGEHIGVIGPNGAGKTTFTQSFAKALGIVETVNSPTFVIQRIYTVTDTVFQHLIHIDAYRLESGKELLHLGWKEIAEDPKNLIVIEWPEKVADILPDDMIKLQFEFIDEKTRKIEI